MKNIRLGMNPWNEIAKVTTEKFGEKEVKTNTQINKQTKEKKKKKRRKTNLSKKAKKKEKKRKRKKRR